MTIHQLEQRLAANEAKQQELRRRHLDELHPLQREHLALQQSLTREGLKALIGQPVQLAYLGDSRFDGRTGELVDVARANCVVTFDGKRWRFPIGDIVAAGAPQSELLAIGAGR